MDLNTNIALLRDIADGHRAVGEFATADACDALADKLAEQ